MIVETSPFHACATFSFKSVCHQDKGSSMEMAPGHHSVIWHKLIFICNVAQAPAGDSVTSLLLTCLQIMIPGAQIFSEGLSCMEVVEVHVWMTSSKSGLKFTVLMLS